MSVGFLVAGSTYIAIAFVVLGIPYAVDSPGLALSAAADLALAVFAAATAAAALRIGAGRLRALEL
jgi:hypothetical protein